MYEPREDSFLLQKYVRRYARGSVLDIGTGSGILAQTAAQKRSVSNVLAGDIDKAALQACARHPKIEYRYSNLFSRVQGKFDTIIFNPPYLPSDRNAPDTALDGGRKGYEVLEKFLRTAGSFLSSKGVLLILFSSLTNKGIIDRILLENLYLHQELAKQHVFFEDLYVYKVWKHPTVRQLAEWGMQSIQFFTRGKRGMIWIGTWRKRKVAVKLQLPGVPVKTIAHEYRMLTRLNKHGIGPRVLWHKGNMMVYFFVNGTLLPDYIAAHPTVRVRRVLCEILQQCRVLDKLGVTKQEMHHPFKHIVVTATGKPVLLDFERCRTSKKQKNVTQFCQYIAAIHPMLARKKIRVNLSLLRRAAQQYKRDPGVETYGRILECLT